MPNIVTDERKLTELVDRVLDIGEFAFDVETVGTDSDTLADIRLDPHRNEVVWLAFATTDLSFVVPIGHPHGDQIGTHKEPRVGADGKTRQFSVPTWAPAPRQIPPAEAFGILRPLLYTEGVLKAGHNIKFDLESCQKYCGDEVAPPGYFDTMVASQLLDENEHDYRLGPVLKRTFDVSYDKSVGKQIERYGFRQAAVYNHTDTKWTWLLKEVLEPRIGPEGAAGVWRLEMDILEVLLYMEREGAAIDRGQAETLKRDLGRDLDRIRGELFRLAGGREINFNSTQQMQELLFGPKSKGGRGLKPKLMTSGGKSGVPKPSTAKAAIELYADDPFVATYLEMQDVDKVHGTYLTAYLGGEVERNTGGKRTTEYRPSILVAHPDGSWRVHANFKQTGTVTGRFSCVSGDTLLETNRGVFRFDEYEPVQGDLVQTHTGDWKPVLRKIYRGVDRTFHVVLDAGVALRSTADHRVLTPDGWAMVGDLLPGDEVYTHAGVYEVRGRPSACPGGTKGLFEPGATDSYHDRRFIELPGSGCSSDPSYELESGEVQGREEASLLAVEDRRAQPNDWQEWIAAPQLCGGLRGRQGVFDEKGRTSSSARTPNRDGRGSGSATGWSSSRTRRAPHRLRQEEQLSGQPCTDNSARSPFSPPYETSTVRAVDAVGAVGVWDIEVADDHSYLSGMLISHNCSEPNLQNIPRPDDDLGQKVRGLFVAPPGHLQVVADYGQIEYVVMAHFSKDPVLVEAFNTGVDLHEYVAAMVFNIDIADVTKIQRGTAKNTNFAVAYGAGDDKVASMSKITIEEAVRFRAAHRKLLPTLYRWSERVVLDARSLRPPHITTILGRKRRLPALNYQAWGPRKAAERQAVNSKVQGSAADLIKLAMVRLHRLCDEEMRLSLSIHDELVLVVPEDRVEDGQRVMREAMLGDGIQRLLDVPMKIDMQVVDRWSKAKEK